MIDGLRCFGYLGVGAVLSASASAVFALGFGSISETPVLGEPLSVSIPVFGSGDEKTAPAPECIKAEVTVGENPLVGKVVRTQIASGAKGSLYRVLVSTEVRINEPLVSLSLKLGCLSPLTKQFVLFVDPPASVTTPVALSAAPEGSVSIAPVLSRSISSTDFSTEASGGSQAPAPEKPKAKAEVPRRVRPPVPTGSSATAEVPAASLRKASAKAESIKPEAQPSDKGPRLSLEAPSLKPGSALPPGRDPDLSAQLAKLSELEDMLKQLAADSKALQDNNEGLKAQLRGAEANLQRERQRLQLAEQELEKERQRLQETPLLVWIIAAAVGVLGLALVMVLWNQRRRPAPFMDVSSASGDSLSGLAPESVSLQPPLAHDVPALPALDSMPSQLLPPEVFDDPENDLPLNHEVTTASGRAQELAAEELDDLEQQADFFLALGQEQATIDLLSGHVENPKNQSAIPYLKLMEIHRRRNDQMAYEKLRLRFQRRFNGRVPDWATPESEGKTLEDYPSVSQTLTACWGTPASAMKLLHGFLFRQDGQTAPFDLPAYRELMMLYSVARDLSGGGPGAKPASTAA